MTTKYISIEDRVARFCVMYENSGNCRKYATLKNAHLLKNDSDLAGILEIVDVDSSVGARFVRFALACMRRSGVLSKQSTVIDISQARIRSVMLACARYYFL